MKLVFLISAHHAVDSGVNKEVEQLEACVCVIITNHQMAGGFKKLMLLPKCLVKQRECIRSK
jgi:hypothetical protein